jgi:hypothetical protein
MSVCFQAYDCLLNYLYTPLSDIQGAPGSLQGTVV